ncbi:hypothetical protein Tco_1578911, partial [Tanacetum coccineum]
MNQNHFEHNSNYSGFDQPPQYSINHQEDLNQQGMNDVHDRWDKMIESGNKLIQFLGEMLLEQAANIDQSHPQEMSIQDMEDLNTYPSQHFKFFCYDDDDDYDYEESNIPLNEIVSQILSSIAITLVLSTLKPEDSLIMGNEELSTIPKKESDEFIKS